MGFRRFSDAKAATVGWESGSLLDVGCGKGQFMDHMRSRGFRPVHGTEIVPELLNDYVKFAWAHELPYDDDEFDYVTCWDVIEHLLPGDELPALQSFQRIARKGIAFSINSDPSQLNGDDLHINIKHASQWDSLIRSMYESAQSVSMYTQCFSPVWVVKL